MKDTQKIDIEKELKNCKTLDDLLGKNGLIKRLTKNMIENMLEEEMAHHLGYQKHDSSKKQTSNSRNGTSQKTVRSSFGNMELDIPRDREGEFHPQVVQKHQRDISTFDQQVISMYSKGMSTRDIQEHIMDLYGVDISPTMVSMITDKVKSVAREWQSRPLDNTYAIVYFDAIHYKVRENSRIVTKAAYTCLGINMNGVKEILGIWIDSSEGATYWLKVITELQTRGIKDVLIACVDGLKGLPEAIHAVYPKTEIQLCVVHLIRNSLKFIPNRVGREFTKELKLVYTAPSEEAGYDNLQKLNEKWGGKYPLALKPWLNNWNNISPFFKYPEEVRRIIYTTNAVEAIHRGFRKVTKSKGVFPSDESLFKQLYLITQNISKKWRNEVRGWRVALGYFSIAFSDRLNIEEIELGM